MKILHVFLNHLRFILKQGTTSFLIMAYPLLLIAIIGTGLDVSSTEHKLSVAIVGDDPVFDALADEPSINLIKVADKNQIDTLIKNKQAIMGINIEQKNGRKNINVHMDSTKQAIASNLLLQLDKAINKEKFKSGESLKAIQAKLAPQLIEIKKRHAEIGEFIEEIQLLRENVTETEKELKEAKAKLTTYKTELIAYKSDLAMIDGYTDKITGYNTELSAIAIDAANKETERDAVVNKININIWKIDGYIDKVDAILDSVHTAKAFANSTYVNYYLNQIEDEAETLRSDLIDAKADLITTRNELIAIDFNSLQGKIIDVKSELAQTNSDLMKFKNNANAKIDAILSEVDFADKKIGAAINSMAGFKEKLTVLEDESLQTKTLIGKVIVPLEEFLGKKPEELIPPEVNSFSVFQDEKSINMFFPAIVGIDMVLICLLLPMIMKVRAKDQGVDLRMARSKANSLSIVLGETLANYVVCMFQLLIIFAIGALFFGVQLGGFIGFFAVLLTVPLVFTSLGVLFSQIVSRSSSAFLLSLLISVPMIFISGTVIPVEFLSPYIQMLGTAMPLYVVIDFTEKLFFRHVAPLNTLFSYVYMMAFSGFNILAAIVVYMFKR